jgi:hypothetical protein
MSIAAANDWFLVQKELSGKILIWPIACWRETASGTVDGLVSTTLPPGVPYLSSPPATDCLSAAYKHLSELTPEELEALRSTKQAADEPAG